MADNIQLVEAMADSKLAMVEVDSTAQVEAMVSSIQQAVALANNKLANNLQALVEAKQEEPIALGQSISQVLAAQSTEGEIHIQTVEFLKQIFAPFRMAKMELYIEAFEVADRQVDIELVVDIQVTHT